MSRTTIAVFTLGLAAPLLGLGQAPPPAPKPPNTAAISGVVVDGTTGDTVADAVVFLSVTPAKPLGAQTRQLTDERGRFAFVNLPGDATYTVSVTKIGYLPGGYGRDTMPSDPLRSIPLKTAEWVPGVKVP